MVKIDDAIVREGKLLLTGLPFAEGQRVRIVVAEIETDVPPPKRNTIREARRLLRGGVERFEDPFEPMIREEHWETLR